MQTHAAEVIARRIRLGMIEAPNVRIAKRNLGDDASAHVDAFKRHIPPRYYIEDPASWHVHAWKKYVRTAFPLDIEVLERWKPDPILDVSCDKISISKIIKMTCEHFDVPLNEMMSMRRNVDISTPRHVAMFLAKRMTTKSYPEIGKAFANRNHTTVLSAIRKMKRLIARDPKIARAVDLIERRIRGDL